MFQLRSVPVLSDVVVTFLRSITVLTPNGNFWIVPLLHSVSDIRWAMFYTLDFNVEGIRVNFTVSPCILIHKVLFTPTYALSHTTMY
jgi:hypothetical protein